MGLLALSVFSAAGFGPLSLAGDQPVIALRVFANRNFAVGHELSFVLGIGPFGSVYLMPVFLVLVRGA